MYAYSNNWLACHRMIQHFLKNERALRKDLQTELGNEKAWRVTLVDEVKALKKEMTALRQGREQDNSKNNDTIKKLNNEVTCTDIALRNGLTNV